MVGVAEKFFIASIIMLVVPVAILYGFTNNLFPGCGHISPYWMTLLSWFVMVVSGNVVIAFYICISMKKPAHKCKPNPQFLAQAQASLNNSKPNYKKEK